MDNRQFDSLVIFFNVLASVGRAFLANRSGNNKWVPLPIVASEVTSSLSMDQLVAKVDRIVRFIIKNTAHPCLYYSYVRCRILRRYGYPVKLNIGMHNLQGKHDAEGHCWLSLDGQVLFEEEDPHEMYPDRMGEQADVVYWARLKKEEGKKVVRLKKE